MDERITSLFAKGDKKKLQINEAEQTIAVLGKASEPGEAYPVRPLSELYGPGTGIDGVEFADETFYPLLIPIEEAILNASADQPGLTDGAVLAALDRLCMSPEANVQNDPLAAKIQFELRVVLTLNDFSRQDVRHCLRKIKQSAARHNKLGGTRGYLQFIAKMLGQK